MKCCDCGWKLTSLFAKSVSVPRSVSAPSRNSSKVPRRSALPGPYLPSLMMADWLPCSIRRPIPPSRPAMLCRIGPLSIRSSSARGSPNSCSGRSTPSAIPIAVTATPSSVTVTSPGVSCKSAPCARSTRRGKSSLSTTAGPRCPSCRRLRVRSVRHKSLSPCSVRPTTPLPRPPGPSHCRTGCKAMSVPLSFSAGHRHC